MVGGHLRRILDSGFVVIGEGEDDSIWLYDHTEFVRERDNFVSLFFDKGRYSIVPLTTGWFLQRPFDLDFDPYEIDCKGEYEYSKIHPYLDSTLSDMFNKIDLSSNHQLEARELNRFGNIIQNS